MPTVFTRKTNGFSCLYDRKLTQSYTTSQDGFTCPDKYRSLPKQSGKIIFQTLALWPFRDKSLYACKHGWRIAKHFPILSPFYNSSGPVGYSESRPGPYLFHSIGMQNQFPHYGQAVVLPYQVPMPHASPSTSSVASSESKNTTNEENPQPGATNRNRGSNWADAETSYLLELRRDNFPISKKRNSTVWDAIVKKLNSIFKYKGIPSYRTSTQCKACIKYLQDIPDSIPSTNSTKTWRTVNKLTFTAFSPFFVWLKP